MDIKSFSGPQIALSEPNVLKGRDFSRVASEPTRIRASAPEGISAHPQKTKTPETLVSGALMK